MNTTPKFHPTHQNSCKTRKYNINNENKYIKSMQMTRIMAALWALCSIWFLLIKTASSLNIIDST